MLIWPIVNGSLLIFVRCFAFVVLIPIFRSYLGLNGVFALSFALSLALFPQASFSAEVSNPGFLDNGELLLLGAREFLVGAAAALPIAITLECLPMVGRLVDFFRGAQFAEQLYPGVDERACQLENLLGILTALVFINAYQFFFASLQKTFLDFPFEFSNFSQASLADIALSAAESVGKTLFTSLALAAPVMLSLLALDLALCLLSRALARVQLIHEFQPLRLLLGLLIFSWAARGFPAELSRLLLGS